MARGPSPGTASPGTARVDDNGAAWDPSLFTANTSLLRAVFDALLVTSQDICTSKPVSQARQKMSRFQGVAKVRNTVRSLSSICLPIQYLTDSALLASLVTLYCIDYPNSLC
jgi:hypothetical protein